MTSLQEALRIIRGRVTIDDPETNTYIPVLNLANKDERDYYNREKKRKVDYLEYDDFYNTIVIKL